MDDACQTTFVTLFRKASTIREPDALAGWLTGVASRTASRVRRGELRRSNHERKRAELTKVIGEEPPFHDPDGLLLDELERLPEPYREAIMLCHLAGLGHEEAAARLGWPLGTLKVRLVRGRRRLRERLNRRGLTIGAALALAFWPGRRLVAAWGSRRFRPSSPPRRLGVEWGKSEAGRSWIVPARLSALVVLLLVTLVTSWAIAEENRSRHERDARFASLPAGLVDVLNVDCD